MSLPYTEPSAPTVDGDSESFWNAMRKGILVIQWCDACARPQFPPRALCTNCLGPIGWTRAAGSGVIYSMTEVHRPPPGFGMDAYLVGLVDLDEQVRIIGRIISQSRSPKIGDRVQVAYDHGSEVTLPHFDLVEP